MLLCWALTAPSREKKHDNNSLKLEKAVYVCIYSLAFALGYCGYLLCTWYDRYVIRLQHIRAACCGQTTADT